MKIIDAHTHFYPDFVAKNPEEWANRMGELYWSKLVGKRPDGKLSLQGFPSEKRFLEDMDSAGIEKAIVQGWYWQHHKTCVEMNTQIAKFANKYPDRIIGFASISPAYYEESLEEIKRAFELGLCGIGELHDGVQGFDLLSEEFCEITNTATKYNMPVCLHLTENNDRQYLGKTSTDNNSAYQLALRQPNAKFIFAHWSGLDAIAKANFTLPKNVFIDSAATPLLCPNAWEVGIKNFPQQAIFGSDYPLRLYPRNFREPELATIIMDAKKNMQTGYAENFFSSNLEKILSCANR